MALTHNITNNASRRSGILLAVFFALLLLAALMATPANAAIRGATQREKSLKENPRRRLSEEDHYEDALMRFGAVGKKSASQKMRWMDASASQKMKHRDQFKDRRGNNDERILDAGLGGKPEKSASQKMRFRDEDKAWRENLMNLTRSQKKKARMEKMARLQMEREERERRRRELLEQEGIEL
jgi:hypothetical protein